MLADALRFLVNIIFALIVYSALLRFIMQWLRAPFRNPLGQAVVALTDWAVKPVRRVVPGYKGIDGSTLLLVWVSEFLWMFALELLDGTALDGTMVATWSGLKKQPMAPASIARSTSVASSRSDKTTNGTRACASRRASAMLSRCGGEMSSRAKSRGRASSHVAPA